ncbi:NTP transferase domain-containing protein [Rhodococcus sp. 1R11]|uniref:NTP transferase domain-containing protein n=1 Tax=Rhodococcus sp. 1R11 TaxID=2559614 RepID=UPI002468EA28|nr:NTP transferase domain-containing protein [Rhodococcus sp. 1R11]
MSGSSTDPICDAIVLAGGRGSRMAGLAGSPSAEVDKPALTVGGRRLVDIAVAAVSGCRRTVLVGPTRDAVSGSVVQTRESPAGGGPVAALAAGLELLDGTADLVAVVASDIPLLNASAVQSLIGHVDRIETDAVFAADATGRTQFLLGVWRYSALRSAVAALDTVEGAPMRALVPNEHRIVTVADIEDCDTPADLVAARAAAASRSEDVLDIDAAHERIRQRVAALPVHRIPLQDTAGTVLAQPLVAATALPAVDISAMDGFAVSGPPPWTLRPDIAYAGTSGIARLADGSAVRIATGAALPPGATAVVRDEHAITTPDGVVERAPTATATDDTRRRGEDWLPGTELVAAGTAIDAAVRSLAASAELTELDVRGPVRARIVISGNEIRVSGPLAPGETRDVLGSALPEYLAHCGIAVVDALLLDDTATAFADLLGSTENIDLVVVVGATGGGAADQLRSTLAALGAETVVGRVRVRPGGSQITATLPAGTVVLGLPGNPLAAVSTALLTAPAIVDALTARIPRSPRTGLLSNASEVRAPVARIVPVVADGTRWRADTKVRTAHLAHLVGRDALAVIPADVSADEPVTILPLPY